MGGQRLAAQPGPASVSQLFHGVPGGCPHAGPPDQEGAERTAQNGGQLPQVERLPLTYITVSSLPVLTHTCFADDALSLCGMGDMNIVVVTAQVCASRPSLELTFEGVKAV